MTVSPTASPTVHDNDEPLLSQVLRCYKPHCRYVRSMTVTATGDVIRGRAELGIGESCYIDETGHLNAVEVNIGYNQMLYYAVAKSVRERLGPIFSQWTMEDYWRRQLPDILITKLTSRFRWPVNPRRFYGEFELTQATQRRLTANGPPLISLETAFRYWDDHKGQSDGEVTVAILAGQGPTDAAATKVTTERAPAEGPLSRWQGSDQQQRDIKRQRPADAVAARAESPPSRS